MPADYATRLPPADIDEPRRVSCAQQRPRSATDRDAAAGHRRGVTFDRLQNAKRRAAQLADVLGQLPGHALLAARADHAGERRAGCGAAWAAPIPGDTVLEATPLVVDGVMYVTSGGDPLTVIALDARTGRQIWRYTRPQKVTNPYEINPFNRGVAILGNRLFVGTLDAALVALDARTGLPLWETQIADTMRGHSITSPPLVVKDKVIVGITGGEFATRGFLDAYDAATRQAAVAVLHDSRPRRVRQRHLEGRQLEDRRLRRRG